MNAKDVQKALRSVATEQRRKTNMWFFKTAPGDYGAGDIFIGVSSPQMRKIARDFSTLSLSEMQKLLRSKVHEDRLTALVMLTNRFNKHKEEQKKIFEIYLKHIKCCINNWDLVDISTPRIVGAYILENTQSRARVWQLATSKNMWERRVAILATFPFIKAGEYAPTLRLAKQLLNDTEDLSHKALGWMLREIWKKDAPICEQFLQENYTKLPRTTLRYAIERMDEKSRKRALKGDFK